MTSNKSNVNNFKTIRLVLICLIFCFSGLTLITISLGAAPTPSPTISQSETISNLTNQVRNWQNLADYYQNQTQSYQNLYENESVNISNRNIIEIKNNINYINQNITQLNQDIKNIGTNLEINFYIGLIIEITLVSLFAIGVYIKRNAPKIPKKDDN